jgi:pteridine reductase
MSESPLPLALVTGSAHRLGAALALELARQGYAIGLHYHSSAGEAARTQAQIQALGIPALLFPADLSRPDEITRLFDQLAAIEYPLKVLVNSAAIMERGNLRELSAEDWDRSMALNLRAPFLCAQAAAQLMGKAGGVIINISDSGAGKAWTGFPAYIVSKAGLEALTRLLARALAPEIRVNAIAPGLYLPSAEVKPEDWERLVKRLPVPRAASNSDLGQAIAFLLANEYITGQILRVDGGYHLI